MAAFQIVSLDTVTPQLRAPGTGDTYTAPRAIAIAPEGLTGTSATTSLDITQTWNTTGTPSAIKLNVTDTASNASSLLMDLQVGGVSQFRVSKAGATTTTGALTTGGSATIGGNISLPAVANNLNWGNNIVLVGDANNILAQRNGVNAQAFRVYNTFTDASNYERAVMTWTGNDLKVGIENAGTGASTRQMLLYSGGLMRFYTGNTHRWSVDASGNFVTATDNTVDIGASGANRPRNLYMASWLRMATTVVASLPAAATAGAGARMFVTDATSPVFGSAVAGGGAVTVPVYSTGSAWNVG